MGDLALFCKTLQTVYTNFKNPLFLSKWVFLTTRRFKGNNKKVKSTILSVLSEALFRS